MMRSWWVFVGLSLLAPPATAEIFKCSDGKGNAKYQNFPCPIDSIGSTATAVAPKENDAASPRQSARASQVKAAATQAPAPIASGPRGEPRIGMTMEDVRASTWGEPVRTETSEIMEGIIEIWYYDDSRTVQFDSKGRVFLVEH